MTSVAYRDDLMLLATTASTIRIMLDLCSQFVTEYSVSFIANKGKCHFFKAKSHVGSSTHIPPSLVEKALNLLTDGCI